MEQKNNKTYAFIGFFFGILLAGLISFVAADFVINSDGSSTFTFKTSNTDTLRMVNALRSEPNRFVPTGIVDDQTLIGQTCLNYLNTYTKNYEVSQAVKIAEASEKVKPGITFDTAVNAGEAELG